MTTQTFSNVEVLQNFIIFQFLDEIDRSNRNAFHEKTASGIILKSSIDRSTKDPRWGKVLAVGPDVIEDITVGSHVLIEALKWTKESSLQGERFARTQDTYVLAIADE